VQIELVKFVATAIQIGRAPLDGFVREPPRTRNGRNGSYSSLAQVLVDATRLVEAPERRFVPVNDVAALRVIEALVVDTREPIDETDVPGFRDERLFVHESPQGNEAVDASGLLVVAENALDLQHRRTVMSALVCLRGSYRERNREDDSRIRSICGSCFVVQTANRYRPVKVRRPARNE